MNIYIIVIFTIIEIDYSGAVVNRCMDILQSHDNKMNRRC